MFDVVSGRAGLEDNVLGTRRGGRVATVRNTRSSLGKGNIVEWWKIGGGPAFCIIREELMTARPER